MEQIDNNVAHFHLPGLFEFYEFYKEFLPLFKEHREYFYEWCDIGSIYGAPADCLWGGGRVGFGDNNAVEVLSLMREYGISSRLTFSNSLINESHLLDAKCNRLCSLFNEIDFNEKAKSSSFKENGIIIYSDLLLDYIRDKYKNFYFVSSTTKVITDFESFYTELKREDFEYVVPDFRLNKCFERLKQIEDKYKRKVEFLVNECCWFGCKERKACYENVSKKALNEDCEDHICCSPDAGEGYVFSKAMENQGFISIDDIKSRYLKMGYNNFKIEGRSLGTALILEFILYYMTKPECQLKVREKLYLSNTLDLF